MFTASIASSARSYAAGFKAWPTEVESILYRHPVVKETCVVGVPDPVRVEEVRANIVLKENFKGKVSEETIISWSREQMAAYKYPRQVIFVNDLPKSATGKNLWRQVQDETRAGFKTKKQTLDQAA